MSVSIQQIIVGSDLIRRAYDFAKNIHQGQRRKNGEPIFNHCLATAEKLAGWRLDEETIAAGLLHDVPFVSKNPSRAVEEIKKNFGERIALVVAGVDQIGKISSRGTESKVENLRKFILYLSRDIAVIFIKFASRLDTLKILYAYPKDVQKHIALKTMDVYGPLARELGMCHAAGEMEDLAFPYLYPEDHKWLMSAVKDRYEERERYLEQLKPILKRELELNGVSFLELNSRAKHYFSLYKKLLRYNMDLDKIYDLVALRLIVKDISDCYTALGIIHRRWPPLSGRIKDYIASPKTNGYRSLHTTVYGPDNKTAEIQIRTQEMHEEAELGIAAHFAYQEFKSSRGYLGRLTATANPKELNLIRELRAFPKKLTEVDFFKDRILVLTPKGDVIDLPAGATPVDFAYKIHSDIGDKCVGAKVNEKIATLNTELQSGDIVEILTKKNKGPSQAWLTFVKTPQARERIKISLRESPISFQSQNPKTACLLVTIADHPGLIKLITQIFRDAKIKISTLTIGPANKTGLKTLKITSPALAAARLKKLVEAIKKLPSVKKVNYHLN